MCMCNMYTLQCYDVNSSQSDLLVAINRLYNWSCVWHLQIALRDVLSALDLLLLRIIVVLAPVVMA